MWFSVYKRFCSIPIGHTPSLHGTLPGGSPGGWVGRPVLPRCRNLPAVEVLGVRGPSPWALGNPGCVCLLSWASSQCPFCSSWADIMHYRLGRATVVGGGGPSSSPLGMEPTLQGARRRQTLASPNASVYTRALLPSLSLCFSFFLGQMNVWGKICNPEQPPGGDEGDLEDKWLLVSAHLLWPLWTLTTRFLLLPLSTPPGLSHSLNN